MMDVKTLGVFTMQLLGSCALLVLHGQGILPAPLALAGGVFFMNLSFTSWHECSHGNFSRRPALNTTLGILSSWLSLFPGYFSRRREHLAHHRWEGDARFDPVFPRIQTNAWLFPFRLFSLLAQRQDPIPAEFLPRRIGQAWADRITVILAFATGALCFSAGYGWSWLLVFFVPRLLVVFIHAYYICFFPHAKPEGGFEKYRIVSLSPLYSFFTLGQNLHGLHHQSPNVPWHRYRTELSRRGVAKTGALP